MFEIMQSLPDSAYWMIIVVQGYVSYRLWKAIEALWAETRLVESKIGILTAASEIARKHNAGSQTIIAELRDSEASCYRQLCVMSERIGDYQEARRELTDAVIQFQTRSAQLRAFEREFKEFKESHM